MQNQKMMFMTPPKVEMKELKNLFFQLCSKTCKVDKQVDNPVQKVCNKRSAVLYFQYAEEF